MQAKILVVDDTPINVRLLSAVLIAKGYRVVTASGGYEGLARVASECPDLVLLDVMMPDLDGYAVCRALRAKSETAVLPIIMVTALDPTTERVHGLEAGADDFLSKPINQPELLARVRSLLRIKEFHDKVQAQARELAQWNHHLEVRVSEAVQQVELMSRLKRFLSPHIAELVMSHASEDLLKSHRREITVVFLDLRGFTAFNESVEPEQVMAVLHEYHEAMGQLIMAYDGTIEHFAGDGIMIMFNAPVTIDQPAASAVRMAVAMRAAFAGMAQVWSERGYTLGLGIGIDQGYATLGTIGFDSRRDYAAIGPVCNMASRLCNEAQSDQILVSLSVLNAVQPHVVFEPVEPLSLKGIEKRVPAFAITQWV